MYIICKKYCAQLDFNQIRAQQVLLTIPKGTYSVVSLAIVQPDLESLIVFDYNFLWHFCYLCETDRMAMLSTWRCYFSIFVLRNAQQSNETDWEGIFVWLY